MATSTAGTLAVNLIAETKKFASGIANARKTLFGFKTDLATVGANIAKWSTAAVLAVGAVGTAFAKMQLTELDALGKLSDKLGGMKTEFIEFWTYAGKIQGVDAPALNKSWELMIRNVGDAARGMGEAQKALGMLGLDAVKLSRTRPERTFELIVGAIRKLPTGIQSSVLADIFGRGGPELLKLVNADLKAIGKTFQEIGGGRVSREGIRPIEALNDAITTMKEALSFSGRDLVIGISPYALKAIEQIQQQLIAAGVIKAKFKEKAGQPAGKGGFWMGDVNYWVGNFMASMMEAAGDASVRAQIGQHRIRQIQRGVYEPFGNQQAQRVMQESLRTEQKILGAIQNLQPTGAVDGL